MGESASNKLTARVDNSGPKQSEDPRQSNSDDPHSSANHDPSDPNTALIGADPKTDPQAHKSANPDAVGCADPADPADPGKDVGDAGEEGRSTLCCGKRPTCQFIPKGITRPNYKYISLMFVALVSCKTVLLNVEEQVGL